MGNCKEFAPSEKIGKAVIALRNEIVIFRAICHIYVAFRDCCQISLLVLNEFR